MPRVDPKNFVPAVRRLSREELTKEIESRAANDPALAKRLQIACELADGFPAGHDRERPNLWSGDLVFDMTVRTPIVSIDHDQDRRVEEGTAKGHTVYGMRLTDDGKPALLLTQVKGMLSSAYEAVTNSRLRVFSEADGKRLSYRMHASAANRLVPARVVEGGSRVQLYRGHCPAGQDPPPVAAAWLAPNMEIAGVRVVHQEELYAWLRLVRSRKMVGGVMRTFFYWKVAELTTKLEELSATCPLFDSRPSHSALAETIRATGIVNATGMSVENKHDERFFFRRIDSDGRVEDPEDAVLPLSVRERWKEILDSYAAIRETVGQSEFELPRHATDPDMQALADGTLCYADVVRRDATQWIVQDLYPSMISRALYELSPACLLHDSLKPARSREEFSPADRVFGGIARQASGNTEAVRSAVVPLSVQLWSAPEGGAVHTLAQPIQLRALSGPKPQYAPGYVANGPHGLEIPKEGLKAPSFYRNDHRNEQSLRGRATYETHRDKLHPWSDSLPNGVAAPQMVASNVSIRGWIKQETVFRCRLSVSNLTQVELGALVWMLNLDGACCLKIGSGAPLGFGAVHLSLVPQECRKRTAARFLEFDVPGASVTAPEVDRAINAFKRATVATWILRGLGETDQINKYGTAFDGVHWIAAFVNLAKGPSGPDVEVRYPQRKDTKRPNRPPEFFTARRPPKAAWENDRTVE